MKPPFQLKRTVALCAAAFGILASITFCTPPTAPVALSQPWDLQGSSVEQFQPPIRLGGRANTIAVLPNDGLILVASESGGLFRSFDGGNKWQHVDNLPVFYTNAVAFAKDNVVIVTATEDFSASNLGGIWKSEDGGSTWTQVPFPPGGAGKRLSAYEISIAPNTGKIYVATNYGVWISDDPKGETWSKPPVDPFADPVNPPADRRVMSVLALSKNLVLAGGPAGIRRSTDGGTSWLKPTPPSPILGLSPDTIEDMHAFARSPAANDQAYVVARAQLDDTGQKLLGLPQNEWNAACKDEVCHYMVLYLTPDGGDTWEQKFVVPLNTCRPPGSCCGGIGFVKAIGEGTSFDLYVSNRCYIWKLPHGATKWEAFIINHYDKTFTPPALQTSEVGDTRDIAFNSKNEPILVASDNGLAKPPDATSTIWTLAGANGEGNGPNGYNALQIYEVNGQWIGDSRHDLYFGTQDNSLWSSSDTGESWNNYGNEGGFFEAEYYVATESDSQLTFFAGENKFSGPLFKNAGEWYDPPNYTPGFGNGPKIIMKNFHVQGVEDLQLDPLNPQTWKLQYATKRGLAHDHDGLWKQYAIIEEDRRDLPKLSAPPKTQTGPVLYQAIRIGGWWNTPPKGEKIKLARIVKKPSDPLASITTPTNTNNYMTDLDFEGIGSGPNSPYQVFAVDPGDTEHVIAADVFKEQMKETSDGGYKWKEIPQLTSFVKDGGKLNFYGRTFFSQYPAWGVAHVLPVTQASAISFCPDDPRVVAVGTVQGGIFISNDRGKDGTWKKVPGSEHATLTSSLHWRKPGDLIVSTYGRGLWRVKFIYLGPMKAIPCNSPDCFHVYYEQPPGTQLSPYDQVAVAYGGRIEGARVRDGILQELFVRPRTTVAFGTDSQQMPNIKVTETTGPVRLEGITKMPTPPKEAPIMTGLTFKKRGEKSELVGFLFSPRPRSMYTPEERGEAEEKPVGRRPSPTQGKPYLEVLTGAVTGPNATIQLAGRNVEAGRPVEIAVDGNTVQRLVADREGRFSSSVRAPMQFGLHSLTLIDSVSGKILDGAMISVRPIDTPRSR